MTVNYTHKDWDTAADFLQMFEEDTTAAFLSAMMRGQPFASPVLLCLTGMFAMALYEPEWMKAMAGAYFSKHHPMCEKQGMQQEELEITLRESITKYIEGFPARVENGR